MKAANNAPIYASIYSELAELCRSHGYALAIHGSLARDFDLVAIPWAPEVSEPPAVVTAITEKFALRLLDTIDLPFIKPWSREVYTLIFKWGETALDLSFTPRIPSAAPRLHELPAGEAADEMARRDPALLREDSVR